MYKNRLDAGKILAEKLTGMPRNDICLLAIPRGGVAVAKPIADQLKVKINLLITRKLGHPANPEIAIGAVMPDGSAILDPNAANLTLSEAEIHSMVKREYAELKRRQQQFSADEIPREIKEKIILVVDDGIATGYTIMAALRWLHKQASKKVILAVPVAPLDVLRSLSQAADRIICPLQVKDLIAVSLFYEDFSPTSDQEVCEILSQTVSFSL